MTNHIAPLQTSHMEINNTNSVQIRQYLQNRQFKQAERLAIADLQAQPLIAQTWVFLGEALLQQGYGAAARRVFRRGAMLDPQATWMDTVEAALAQAPEGPVHAAVDHLLAVEPVTVAAAIMTHNEARCIER
jgi:cytochrome c-type biogenesis protein CcmH/NrfG